MAVCDGLHLFEKPLPWNHADHYSFTELFGQLDSKDNVNHILDSLESSPSAFPSDQNCIHQEKKHQRRDSISSMNSESVSTCTEELGSEDSDQDSLKNESYGMNDWQPEEDRSRTCRRSKRFSRRNMGSFPPPISCIGRNGKPWVCFESVREDGRFILTEVRIPTQEFLHSCRKNGRLKMQFVQSDDEFLDEDEEENAEEDDEGTSEVEDGDSQGTCV